MTESWLEKLAVGDEVIVETRSNLRLEKVEKVYKLHFLVGNGWYRGHGARSSIQSSWIDSGST